MTPLPREPSGQPDPGTRGSVYIAYVEGVGAVLTPLGAQRWERMEKALATIAGSDPSRGRLRVGECICPNGGRMVTFDNCPVHDEAAAMRVIATAALVPPFRTTRPDDPEPLGTCVIHGDYWTDDCTRCDR